MKRRYSIFYFFSQSFKNLTRNKVMTLASISVLMSCLVVLGGFALLVLNLNINLKDLSLENEIMVFLEYNLDEEKVNEIHKQIEALDNVDTVTFIPKETGLEEMSDKYSDEYSSLFEILKDDNPFADAFLVTYKDNAGVSTLDYNLRHSIDGIRTVNNRVDLANKIENLKNGIIFVFLWFLAVLLVVSVFIIVNTIKLSVHSRRNEISVMRYIGATKAFIVTPFVIDGVTIGLLSGGLAFLIEWYMYSYIHTSLQSDVQFVTLIPFDEVRMFVLGAFLAIGVFTGILGSCITLGKHLKS